MTDEVAERLREWCRDWDGSEMADAAETRTTVDCRTMRGAADEIDALRTRIAELERMLGVFLGHDDRFQIMVGGNPTAVEEMMEQARATLNGEKVDG